MADARTTLWLSGNGDVIEAPDGVMGAGRSPLFARPTHHPLIAHATAPWCPEPHPPPVPAPPARLLTAGHASPPPPTHTHTNKTDLRCPTTAIGSGSDYAEAAARALLELDDPSHTAMAIAHRAMRIAADCCVYTNTNFGGRPGAALAAWDWRTL